MTPLPINPIADKREEQRKPATPAFAAAATVIELRRPTWSSSRHASLWESALTAYAFP